MTWMKPYNAARENPCTWQETITCSKKPWNIAINSKVQQETLKCTEGEMERGRERESFWCFSWSGNWSNYIHTAICLWFQCWMGPNFSILADTWFCRYNVHWRANFGAETWKWNVLLNFHKYCFLFACFNRPHCRWSLEWWKLYWFGCHHYLLFLSCAGDCICAGGCYLRDDNIHFTIKILLANSHFSLFLNDRKLREKYQ